MHKDTQKMMQMHKDAQIMMQMHKDAQKMLYKDGKTSDSTTII